VNIHNFKFKIGDNMKKLVLVFLTFFAFASVVTAADAPAKTKPIEVKAKKEAPAKPAKPAKPEAKKEAPAKPAKPAKPEAPKDTKGVK
jgi:hypothetical protein